MGLFSNLFSNVLNKTKGLNIPTNIDEYLIDMKIHQDDMEYLYETYFKVKRAVYIQDRQTLDKFVRHIRDKGMFKKWFEEVSIEDIIYRHDIKYGDECIIFYHRGYCDDANIGIFSLYTQNKEKIPFSNLVHTYSYGWLFYPSYPPFDRYCLVKYKWNDGSETPLGFSVSSYESRKI